MIEGISPFVVTGYHEVDSVSRDNLEHAKTISSSKERPTIAPDLDCATDTTVILLDSLQHE